MTRGLRGPGPSMACKRNRPSAVNCECMTCANYFPLGFAGGEYRKLVEIIDEPPKAKRSHPERKAVSFRASFSSLTEYRYRTVATTSSGTFQTNGQSEEQTVTATFLASVR